MLEPWAGSQVPSFDSEFGLWYFWRVFVSAAGEFVGLQPEIVVVMLIYVEYPVRIFASLPPI